MIVKNPKIQISAMNPNQYPQDNLPEIILSGKSNVGKSSFINTLINRKSLARTSSSPGKTRQLNFYNIDQLFYFVDLPGYGYSEMSKKEQFLVSKSTEEYLFSRKQISLIVLLIDIRHKPSEGDKIMYNFIKQSKHPCLIIASKADKIATTKIFDYVKIIKNELNIEKNHVIIPFSSEKRLFIDETWKELEKYI
jgi:ribosome biogenesis GTP-binding protein YsxC/EngB